MFSIRGSALGSPKSLIVDDDKISWGSPPADCWTLGNPRDERSVSALFEILGSEIPKTIPEEFSKSMDGIASGPVPWPLVIPQQILGEHARLICERVDESIECLSNYVDTLVASRKVLSKLQPCRIDVATLRVQQRQQTTHTLESFEPGPDFMCQAPVYSHGTSTGRLVVKEGPKILTLQKEHRKILASRFETGRVMQIDFVSLEPRVLRLLRNGLAPLDIYSEIAEKLGGATTRRQVKLATLKLIYGSSMSGVREEVGNIDNKSARQIEDYFGISTLRAELISELKESGSIKSYWGRPLPEANETHLLISHFTQSTAVDVSLGGFGQLLSRIESEDLDVIPCYVLHDALLVDVHPNSMNRLDEIVKEGIDIEGLGHFEISLSPAYLEEE